MIEPSRFVTATAFANDVDARMPSVFSFGFEPDWDFARITRMVEALAILRIGFSCGGTVALVMAYESLPRVTKARGAYLVRL